ncbi:MAG: CDP-alcohol phosphatidyltransferase family protein [Bacilli bacterium]|nr:CDP-alcohol phosphatidyltransferase family protein [Bacilli bacterium]
MLNLDKQQLKKDLQNKNAIIPNILSASRIPAPLVILAFTFAGKPLETLLSAGAFALTDFFDGKIARKMNGQTELGRLLDATSDKFFSLGMLLPLIPKNKFLALTASLEAIIAYINSKSYKEGGKPATIFEGKVKTALLSASLLLECLTIASNNKTIKHITDAALIATTILQLSNINQYNKIAKAQKEKNAYKETNNNAETTITNEIEILQALKNELIQPSNDNQKTKVLTKQK